MGVGEAIKQSRARGLEPAWSKLGTRLLIRTHQTLEFLPGHPAGMRGQQRRGVLCPLQAPGACCSRLVWPVVVALRLGKGAVLSSGLSFCDNQPRINWPTRRTGSLPSGESIVSVALGGSFFCLATDRNLLRIHSFSGKACEWVLDNSMVEQFIRPVVFVC